MNRFCLTGNAWCQVIRHVKDILCLTGNAWRHGIFAWSIVLELSELATLENNNAIAEIDTFKYDQNRLFVYVLPSGQSERPTEIQNYFKS